LDDDDPGVEIVDDSRVTAVGVDNKESESDSGTSCDYGTIKPSSSGEDPGKTPKSSTLYTKFVLKSSQKASGSPVTAPAARDDARPQQSFLWGQASTVSALQASLKQNPEFAKELLEVGLAISKPKVEIRRVPSRKSSIRGSKRKFGYNPVTGRANITKVRFLSVQLKTLNGQTLICNSKALRLN
jgi:hypothetical protein